MKKLKISELPLCSTLAGLFTIGVDNLNRSVKVSLQFVEDKVTEAVRKAQEATSSALSAAQAALNAKADTVRATNAADTATAAAKTATEKADKATSEANSAALSASQKAAAADTATTEAKAATTAADEATKTALKTVEETKAETEALISETKTATGTLIEETKTATGTLIEETKTATGQAIKETEEVTAAAQAATAETLAKIAILVPSAMTVEAPKRITWGNVFPFSIKAVLGPVTAMRNLIYISDNKAVEVSIDGVLTPVAKGVSRVHVIPTQNTALARTCVIEVGAPRLRLSSRSALRFTQAGGFRLT